MQFAKFKYDLTSGKPWIITLTDGRRFEFDTWRSARDFCSREGFVPLISKIPAPWRHTSR